VLNTYKIMPTDTAHRTPVRSQVAIIDDHTAIIEMMTQMIETIPGYRVVGSATEALAGLALCNKLQPDLIILDLVLPRRFRTLPSRSPAADLSRCAGSDFFRACHPVAVHGAVRAGAAGFMEKMSTPGGISPRRDRCRAGRTYFGTQASAIIKDFVRHKPTESTRKVQLTPREKDRAGLPRERPPAPGKLQTLLGVSIHTISNHRSRLMKKTGLHRVAQLALHAVQHGFACENAAGQNLSN